MYNPQPRKDPARILLFFNISRNSCFFQRFLRIHIIAIKEAQLNRRMVGSGHNSHAWYTLPKKMVLQIPRPHLLSTVTIEASRFPCGVLLVLSWNTTNENPITDKLSWAINYIEANSCRHVNCTCAGNEMDSRNKGLKYLFIIIGPRSDHSLRMSVTHSLTTFWNSCHYLVEEWMNWPKYEDYADHAEYEEYAVVVVVYCLKY